MKKASKAKSPVPSRQCKDAVEALELLRHVAHTAFHVLDDSDDQAIREASIPSNVDDLEAALQAFIDRFDPDGPGSVDAHAACFAIDALIDRLHADGEAA